MRGIIKWECEGSDHWRGVITIVSHITVLSMVDKESIIYDSYSATQISEEAWGMRHEICDL